MLVNIAIVNSDTVVHTDVQLGAVLVKITRVDSCTVGCSAGEYSQSGQWYRCTVVQTVVQLGPVLVKITLVDRCTYSCTVVCSVSEDSQSGQTHQSVTKWEHSQSS